MVALSSDGLPEGEVDVDVIAGPWGSNSKTTIGLIEILIKASDDLKRVTML